MGQYRKEWEREGWMCVSLIEYAGAWWERQWCFARGLAISLSLSLAFSLSFPLSNRGYVREGLTLWRGAFTSSRTCAVSPRERSNFRDVTLSQGCEMGRFFLYKILYSAYVMPNTLLGSETSFLLTEWLILKFLSCCFPPIFFLHIWQPFPIHPGDGW